MIFSQQSHRFVCCNRCLWKKAIYHVTFALKRSVITNIEQWRNSFVHFYYKKIKKHSWHYRIRKVLKRASGNSLKESYYCTLFSCAADVCTLPEILFSGFLWESIWNFFYESFLIPQFNNGPQSRREPICPSPRGSGNSEPLVKNRLSANGYDSVNLSSESSCERLLKERSIHAYISCLKWRFSILCFVMIRSLE
mgnify:CR=1 FL=1